MLRCREYGSVNEVGETRVIEVRLHVLGQEPELIYLSCSSGERTGTNVRGDCEDSLACLQFEAEAPRDTCNLA